MEDISRSGVLLEQNSVRLIFIKDSELSRVWHIADVAISKLNPDSTVHYMALHGDWIYPVVRADTRLQAELRAGRDEDYCPRCLDEFTLAADIIAEREMVKFK